jgi:hypothetical protein
MKLTARISGTDLEIQQQGGFGHETKSSLNALSLNTRWEGPRLTWVMPYSPATLQGLIETAQRLNATLSLDNQLAGEKARLEAETRQEENTRRLIQRYMDDHTLPIDPYLTQPTPPPWRHQMVAYHWAMRTRAIYLALKPGLGKTRIGSDLIRGKHEQGQVRSAMQFYMEERESGAMDGRVLPARWGIEGAVLIVCPRVVVGEWMEQLYRWQNIKAVPIVGPADRKRYRAGLRAWVHICAYDSLESVEDNRYDGIIGDELHYIANEDSNRWRRMNALRKHATWVVGMSGTPMSNMLKSLWAQYYWLDGGRTLGPSFDAYRKAYFNTSGYKVEEKDTAEERVSQAISRITMFMTMKQAFPGKAEKIQQVVRIPMTTEQAQYYEKLRVKTVAEVITGTVTMDEMMTKLNKLMQVVQGFVFDDNGNVQRFSSAKLKALEEMITGNGDLTDRKVVVWCRFSPDLEAICELLKKHGINHLALHGQVTDTEREKLKHDWNHDPKVKVLVGMIQMGIGINMHAPSCVDAAGLPFRCSTTVFFGLDWRVTQLEQAMDRVYRGDQVETCLYRYLLSDELDECDDEGEPLKPIDVRVYETLIEKLDQAVRVNELSVDYVRRLICAA